MRADEADAIMWGEAGDIIQRYATNKIWCMSSAKIRFGSYINIHRDIGVRILRVARERAIQ